MFFQNFMDEEENTKAMTEKVEKQTRTCINKQWLPILVLTIAQQLVYPIPLKYNRRMISFNEKKETRLFYEHNFIFHSFYFVLKYRKVKVKRKRKDTSKEKGLLALILLFFFRFSYLEEYENKKSNSSRVQYYLHATLRNTKQNKKKKNNKILAVNVLEKKVVNKNQSESQEKQASEWKKDKKKMEQEKKNLFDNLFYEYIFVFFFFLLLTQCLCIFVFSSRYFLRSFLLRSLFRSCFSLKSHSTHLYTVQIFKC